MSISLILNTSRHSTCRRSLATLHSAGFHSRSHHTSFGCASWLGQPRRATDIPILKGTSIPSTYRLASSKISSIPISRSLYGSTVSFSSSASSKAHSSGSSGSGSRGSHKTESQGSWKVRTAVALGLVGAGVVAYHNVQDFRYIVLAGVRCSRVAGMCSPLLSQYSKPHSTYILSWCCFHSMKNTHHPLPVHLLSTLYRR
jgi:hypothetical protein